MKKNFFFKNQEIAELLNRIATAYEIKNEIRFKIKAYQEAAVSVEHSTSELKDLWDEGKLDQVPGIGKAISDHLDELFKTGKVKHFTEILSTIPPAVFVFEKIQGVGPKTAFSLSEKLKIVKEKDAIKKLKDSALKEEIRKFAGFGEKSEKDILAGIALFEKGIFSKKRMPLYVADSISQEIIDYLKENKEVIMANPLGSLRRMLASIGDIDISVSTNSPQEVLEHFYRYPKIEKIINKGEKLLGRVILKSGQQVDIRISKPESYGAMLQYFTGSKQHNISLREFALKKGLSLSEYGIKLLKKVKSEKLKVKSYNSKLKIYQFAEEKGFYNFLGLDWIPPEIREDTGEIVAALRQAQGKQNGLPKLVELGEIKGDLHLHSSFNIEPSHDLGQSNMAEMVSRAEELGYQYLGFSEHNPSVSRHSSYEILDILRLKKETIEKQIYSYENNPINRWKKEFVKIKNGLEIDIKPSGELAIPEKGFDYLDYAIVSIHSSFDMGKKEMTYRVLKGLSHSKVKILGHPTGRLIENREGYELDWDEIFNFCLKNNKFLEISAWPNRLDLPDFLVREAVKNGVKLVINSDSHHVDQMALMKYGVSVARRGWAGKKDILNTLSAEEISDILSIS